MRPCYYINDPVAGRVLIPGCWGRVVGPYCTCPTKRRRKDLDERVSILEQEIADLKAKEGGRWPIFWPLC